MLGVFLELIMFCNKYHGFNHLKLNGIIEPSFGCLHKSKCLLDNENQYSRRREVLLYCNHNHKC